MKKSKLIEWAELEFKYSNYEDEYGGDIKKSVFELLKVFSKQGHSGGSASICLSLFNKLANFEPLSPIMCTDGEWECEDISESKYYQNKRNSAVFKNDKDGKPYYIDAIVWVEESGAGFTGTVEGISSKQFIKIPFVAKKFFIDVYEKNGKSFILDKSQLKNVIDYYITDIILDESTKVDLLRKKYNEIMELSK